MISTGIDQRVKIQQLIENQLPEFLISESPKSIDFFKQYYISQEFTSGPVDIVENLDQYLKLDNLTPEVIRGYTNLVSSIDENDTVITVCSTKGFPNQYGLIKIDDEIITYTGITTNSFIGCVRGFSGITNYHSESKPDELVFSTSVSANHVGENDCTESSSGTKVYNLSSLFLQEFYKKLKRFLTPGLEDVDFIPELDVNNFIKSARSFYQAKGTSESFRILFNILYGETPKVIDLEQFLIKPSTGKFIRREVLISEKISGNPLKLVGQSIFNPSNPTISGSVSSVEIILRRSQFYYKIGLVVSYDDVEETAIKFSIPGKTKVLETVYPGSQIISVDSTIGFPDSGTLISGSNKISYTNKSINQFFGCSGIEDQIDTKDDIRIDEVIYGYEDGDLTKKVELRITGVISDFTQQGQILFTDIGELISVKNLGESIQNPESNKSKKQIFANSWIYNTSCRYQILSRSLQTLTLKSEIDPSSLKEGDKIEILERGTETVVATDLIVSTIIPEDKQITILGSFSLESNKNYDLRRKIEKCSIASGSTPKELSLEYGNNSTFANIQNVYVDDDNYGYVASNSLPSYPLDIEITYANIVSLSEDSYNETTQTYSTFVFNATVPFITGDEVVYESTIEDISGLNSDETYYVSVLSPDNTIKLYTSKSFIGADDYVTVGSIPNDGGTHRLILKEHASKILSPQKLLRKFSIINDYSNSTVEETSPGSVGMCINGVEIISSKSTDRIYYGPLEKINILNGGSNYDVLNPPDLQISESPNGGIDALANLVVSGSIQKVYVDQQDFDISDVVSITLTGGNGSGSVFEPVISKRFREVEFSTQSVTSGGGIDIDNETITFLTKHNFQDCERIIYSSSGYDELGITTYFAYNGNTLTEYLVNGAAYYAKIVNSKTIKLHKTLKECYAGINTIGFTTSNTIGDHKFRAPEKNTLNDIKVINPGSGYQNRKLYVKSSGISTSLSTINFANHGFNDGDKVVYEISPGNGVSVPTPISGLTTTSYYYIIKIDNDSFRLAYAGVGGTDVSNYNRKNYIKFSSKGSGYQVVKYPDITLNVTVSFGSSIVGVITAKPVVRGSVVDTYLYEPGSGYGSKILNLQKNPVLTIKNGKDAEVRPIIVNGKIQRVEVTYGGIEYQSEPDLIVSGDGSGAVVRSVVSNGRVINAIVIKSGSGYSQEKTSISVVSPGNNLKLVPSIRFLSVNQNIKYTNEILLESNNNIEYGYVSYPMQIGRDYFGDVQDPFSAKPPHSPIIGWAYDGNPIYGPYGYSSPNDGDSTARVMKSGYVLSSGNVEDRPSGFPDGYFIEDYFYDGSGDLDEHNGRFCKTIDFPNGTYAYFATVSPDNVLNPIYPYFVGNSYKSTYVRDNKLLDQSFNFNNSSLIRNTFPYKIDDEYAYNDFLIEPNESIDQLSVIESVSKGSVQSFDILFSGDNYKVGDRLIFDETNTNGGGLSASVSEIEGKEILNLETTVKSYPNSTIEWNSANSINVYINPYHELLNNDYVNISGLSSSISQIYGSHLIGISTNTVKLFSNIPSGTGIITDVYVSSIPEVISIGSSLQIENEILRVLNTFSDSSVLRLKRTEVGVSHTSSTLINILSNKFTVPLKTEFFDSKINDLVYFNPKQSVGVGTTLGISNSIKYKIGDIFRDISIPTQSIYLPNHPFKTGQQVTLNRGNASSLFVKNNPDESAFSLPSSTSETVYIINKSKDFIGLTTVIGLTTSTNGLYFTINGDDDYEYYFETNYNQLSGLVEKIETKVSVSTSHELKNGDIVRLSVFPKLSLGIGNSDSIRLKYNDVYNKILVNSVGFASAGINTSTNIITINSHNFKTGDKVFYTSKDQVASGLNTGDYYVYKIDQDKIKLSETYYDTQLTYPNTVKITGIGGSIQELSLVNPQIFSVKNNNLVFDLTDESLDTYNFKLYYDKKFNNQFVSTFDSSDFNVISTGSTLTISYSDNLPKFLYYTLEKSGELIDPDYDVNNFSQIIFIDSVYNSKYSVYGVGSTTFNISLDKNPEYLVYEKNDCDLLKYTTTSKNSSGGISKVNILSKGIGYKKLPKFIEVDSINGKNAVILPISDEIGKIQKTRILEQGFEYSSDKTLRPQAYISPTISVTDSTTISGVNIITNGRNYINSPNLVVVETESRKLVSDDSLSCEIYSGALSKVIINVQPFGLKSVQHEVLAVNNTNGVYISTISSDSNVIRCFLSEPLTGFTENVFDVGDEVFLENIEKEGTEGTGFNSKDNGYQFFKVSAYLPDPAQVILDTTGITTNPGIAKTIQENFPLIVKKSDCPTFEVIQSLTTFKDGEQLLVKKYNTEWTIEDLYVTNSSESYIKVKGKYSLSVDDLIQGSSSGVIAKVESIIENDGRFNINYSFFQDYGWDSNIGRLNEISQVIPDNDYYQNLSYSVKSSIEFEKTIDPINRLVHTSGLKNFSDTEVLSSAKVGVGSTSTDLFVLDILQEERVDSINNFDFGIDIDVLNNKTKSIKLKNKKLSSYINCVSNRVLLVDDVSNLFNNRGTNTSEEGIDYIQLTPLVNTFGRYLIQIIDSENDNRQFSEIIVMNNEENTFTLEKSTLASTDKVLADIIGEINEFGEKYIKLSPTDILNTDLNIKVLQDTFNTDSAGIGTTSVGFINLIGLNSNVLPGTTKTLVSFDKNKIESIHMSLQIMDTTNKLMQYVELFVEHDNVETYFNEYYFDTVKSSYSDLKLGQFNPSISSNLLNIDFYNSNENNVLVKSKVIGFGTTSVGTGVYRFKSSDQPDGAERSALLQSNYTLSGISTTIVNVDSDIISSVKSNIRVSYGETSALHQVMMITNGSEAYTVQYPFISIGSTSGIGTFGSEFTSGSQLALKFYPDSNIIDTVTIQSYNEILYTENDTFNESPTKEFGSVSELIILGEFNAVNGLRSSKNNFDFNYKGIPIYRKTFNPGNSNILDLETGIFTIKNHFFSTLEKLTYNPDSKISGIAVSAINIPLTLNSVGVLTTILPSEVYAIKLNDDQFKLATRKDYAISGISVTFTSTGSGNAHTLDMDKKLEKTVISIDGVVQKPVSFNPISYNLQSNVSVSSTYFALSGIATIKPSDLLKIDDEYVRIITVGFGTTSLGPIGSGGSLPIVNVIRGFVGTAASSHNIGTSVSLYKGSYNIVGNKVYFADSPTGSGRGIDKSKNLPYPKSSFSGRVYLREDYTTNKIYDDISYNFTGIGQTYTLSLQGANTTGIATGDGILFINNIFQTPTTLNNTNNSYSFISNAGITSVVFSGVSTFASDQSIISESDVNQNILPRGGLIVSLGSTPGLGFAPLVGVNTSDLKIILGAGNSIASIGFVTDVYGSGYYGGSISIGITDPNHVGHAATITATIGVGGSITKFNIDGGGFGYQNPYLQIPQPSYSNLPVIGVSRYGVGSTTETGKNLLVTLDVGPSSTTGIGSTLFEVKNFSIARSGYGFKIGDVFKPVGLVTAAGLSSPLADFELTVVDTFEDNFYAWQFGEFDYIDSIKFLQNGFRTRFPLFYDGTLRSFEKDSDSPIDLNAILLIFINGVLQQPGESYIFEGGTSFIFSVAPKPEDRVSIFFYRGTKGVDSFEETINQSLKIGDTVQLIKDNQSSSKFYEIFEPVITNIPTIIPAKSSSIVGIGTSSLKIGQSIESIIDVIPNNTKITGIGTDSILINRTTLNSIDLYLSINVGSISTIYDSLNVTQDPRTIANIVSSDVFDTNLYEGIGINDLNYRPLKLTKQKADKIINGEYVYKSRDILEPTIYPTGRIIRTVFNNDKEFFVDNSRFFDYESVKYGAEALNIEGFDMILVNDQSFVSAALTATVSAAGTIQSLSVVNPGYGYTQSSLTVKIGVPTTTDGERSTAVVNIVNGSVSATPANITNPGSGYTFSFPPQVIIEPPKEQTEFIRKISKVEGFSGIVTGITTTVGIGTNLALKFFLRADPAHADSSRQASDVGNFVGLVTNYPIYIYDTNIGFGVTSIDTKNSEVIGIGTTFLDNVYYIHSGSSLNSNSPNAEIICNVHSESAIVGLSSFASTQFIVGSVGKFSWGRISGNNMTRSANPVSIGLSGYTVTSGLSTFPILQRRSYGLRKIGAIDKISQNTND